MKMLKFLPVVVFAFALVLTTSCGGGSDASKGADFMCKMKELQNEMMKAAEEQDEEKVAEITKELEDLQKEMEAWSKEMKEKYKDDKDAEKKAKEEMFEALSSCEHYTKEELEEIKKYMK